MFEGKFGTDLLLFIVFLVFSALSGKKKRSKKEEAERRKKEEELKRAEDQLKASAQEIAESVGSLWNDIGGLFTDAGEEDHDSLRNQGSGIARVKEQKKDREKKAVFPETIRSLIPADHQSGEGISANSDYRKAERRSVNREENEAILPKSPSPPRHSYVEDLKDLKKAMILKEILERPLSLRRGK